MSNIIRINIPVRLFFVDRIYDLEYLISNNIIISVYDKHNTFFTTKFADPKVHIS